MDEVVVRLMGLILLAVVRTVNTRTKKRHTTMYFMNNTAPETP
ncbi:uncharacterized protein FFB20_04220 [Fusarium fujikuroi]|nr:uncharacterized protein FFE2_00685 [Fusarium fujikuroi]SCN69823.1 uncharacterized protein FFC1_00681 [Fusarium fujikuroi]SCN72758.1 uncharacterized protein FFB20_04220 [Fusarium fujikuroi]SCN73356.1 uncharacterized protein FFM5_00644 [Fusarium fujikuroi]SCO29037.1 uncharacterized protein FFNC_00684 [Fusarium fujikuroi]